MRKLQSLALGTLALAALVALAQPTSASETNVTDVSGFGAGVATATFTSTNTGDFSATVDEGVYLLSGTYTYVFDITNNAGSPDSGSLETFYTATAGLPSVDNFSSSLDYGRVTGSTTGGGGETFTFSPSYLEVGLSTKLPSGDQFTFYAQSDLGPVPGQFQAQDGLFGTTTGNPLDPGPEPRSMLLFGTGLLVLGVMLRRRIFRPIA